MPEIVRSNPTNTPTQKPVKTHSKFEPNFSFLQSQMYGLNHPHFSMETVTDDDISMRCACDLDTYTLNAPAMTAVKRSMDYFQIPLRAVLPRSADFLITNPLRGDDVVANRVNTVLLSSDEATELRGSYAYSISGYFELIRTRLYSWFNAAYADAAARVTANATGYILNFIQLGNYFCSYGSLARNLGIDFGDLISFVRTSAAEPEIDGQQSIISFDDFVDAFFLYLEENFDKLTISATVPYVSGVAQGAGPEITYRNAGSFVVYPRLSTKQAHAKLGITLAEFRHLLFYEPATFVISAAVVTSNPVSADGSFNPGETSNWSASAQVMSTHKNVGRVAAYQIACAEFYTNDKVDDVYSAKTYLANMDTLAEYLFRVSGLNRQYLLNGVGIRYDALAGEVLQAAFYHLYEGLSQSEAMEISSNSMQVATMYLHNYFGYTRSLLYEDYFVGSRVHPLAVGDVNVAVNNDVVDVIDISRNIQVQRFLNQVNRVGRKFSDYVKGILGDAPLKDVHEPIFLGHITDTIGAEETNNTGDAQYTSNNGITSKFRNNSERFCFVVHVSEPSYLIGITNYLLPRAYARGTDRSAYHVDRYDMFNPYMQFTGDQEILRDELDPNATGTFGYTTRYAEYRQRVDRAAGAFAAGKLPGYAFVVNPIDLGQNVKPFTNPTEINSDFLRARVADIEQFYLSLTGFSQASRFHFIVRNDISVSARRPMAFSPSIL